MFLCRPVILSTSHGRLRPLRPAGSWNIPCTWRCVKAALPPQSAVRSVRWHSSGFTVAQRRPARSAPPTWTTLTSTARPPTDQQSSSASPPKMNKDMGRRRRFAGFKVQENNLNLIFFLFFI